MGRFWKRFVDYAKVGICVLLIVFLLQTVTGGPGAMNVVSLAVRGGMLLAIALVGAAGVAVAHEIRRPRPAKDKQESWRKQVPW